jgi:hypothetical protein
MVARISTGALERHGGADDFTLEHRKVGSLDVMHDTLADIHSRSPVVIFLSDGDTMCMMTPHIKYVAVHQPRVCYFHCISFTGPTDYASARKPLSFHAISFGEEPSSSSLRRMAQIALEVQNDWASDPLYPAGANVPSSYTEALDTVSWPGKHFVFR